MPRDVATVQAVSETAGRNVTMTAFVTANGGQYDNALQIAFMLFANGDVSPKTITVSTDRDVTPQEVATTNLTFTLPAGATNFMCPILQNQWWAQAGTTNIYVDVSDDTDVTWAVVSLN